MQCKTVICQLKPTRLSIDRISGIWYLFSIISVSCGMLIFESHSQKCSVHSNDYYH
ncbi:hypothetical protein BDV37DRAFT_246894 [Aspergillus pseudonomiae]|uniref:Uncharacterized protein n=1 Tax=Aspergillus pseudonomiae TaxID=1506151 RepID=A0A5N7DGJ1_9EURO|nr:uncharacterized protein BDV37DRAFT_246894 [Aspergillus pseudonomiae]KAE8404768.1 hypothetical protein BDV37DRAFT_246894 [Aspergillus pseudonomiae]